MADVPTSFFFAPPYSYREWANGYLDCLAEYREFRSGYKEVDNVGYYIEVVKDALFYEKCKTKLTKMHKWRESQPCLSAVLSDKIIRLNWLDFLCLSYEEDSSRSHGQGVPLRGTTEPHYVRARAAERHRLEDTLYGSLMSIERVVSI